MYVCSSAIPAGMFFTCFIFGEHTKSAICLAFLLFVIFLKKSLSKSNEQTILEKHFRPTFLCASFRFACFSFLYFTAISCEFLCNMWYFATTISSFVVCVCIFPVAFAISCRHKFNPICTGQRLFVGCSNTK